ncbi:hypothetical protein [Streptomyces cylindrosporus]|uniref:Uncharacterized protein n=1 Tax=Streptomyces cylindrosporus TaxID=2927583 RepID=A0ABS9YAK2_9ACTN|nr:hypothetical protein [Streptomyces cylindrosporus]MCI3274265.1 hypothetical protein [Streptomyces cylindrosporus]
MTHLKLLAAAASCVGESTCPAIFELPNGDLALIGKEAPGELHEFLPQGTGVGPGEQLVVVPRSVALAAGWQPPTTRERAHSVSDAR